MPLKSTDIDLMTKLNSPGKRLRHLRAIARRTRTYIQDSYNLPEITLRTWENETKRLTSEGAERCIEIFRQEGVIVSIDWLLDGIGLSPLPVSTLNERTRFLDKNINERDEEVCMLRDADIFKKTYKNAFVLVVSNNEMRPQYKPGDYVGGRILKGKMLEKAINRDCIVFLKDGSQYFRRLIKNPKGGFNLTCVNPDYGTAEPVIYQVKVEAAAPIIWHRWKID
jgi:SOS-response transcriptional repressor LexA